MPTFKNHIAFEIARSIKVFLNLETGIIRDGTARSKQVSQQPGRAQPQAANKDEEIARLRAELAQIKSVSGPASQSVDEAPIFFLIGRSKSGTSWLMRLLDSHPEILCRGEGMFFERSSPRSLLRALSRSEDVQRWLARSPWTRQAPDKGLDNMLGAFVRNAMRQRLEGVKRRTGSKKIVGDKSPFKTAKMLKEIADVCPDAKVVHIIRDGRDVAVSSVHHRWNNAADVGGKRSITQDQAAKREAYRSDPAVFTATGESIFVEGHVAEIARSWNEGVGRAVEDASLLGDNYHQLRYEDLLAEPFKEVRRLLEFLGADSTEEVTRGCVEAASFERLSGGRSQGEEDSSSFYRKGVAGDWKNHFTEEDKRVFKEEAGELLIRLGYEKNLDW